MATYSYLSDGCECMAGYVMSNEIMGRRCVDGNNKCRDQIGYNSSYNSISGKCECDYGHVIHNGICQDLDDICHKQLGSHSSYNVLYDKCECDNGYYIQDDRCVEADDICYDKYGYHSSYNSLYDKCECDSGYVLSQKTYGSGYECRSCTDKHGIHAEYDYSSKECECKDGYTPDDNDQCVKKQNNVYFRLLEVDTDNDMAIIKSEYDYQTYLIEYGYGCYSFTIDNYVGDQIVVNLGTDFDLDTYDTIVLQDDDEVCDITDVDRVSSGYSFENEDEEDEGRYYFPSIPLANPPAPQPIQEKPKPEPFVPTKQVESMPNCFAYSSFNEENQKCECNEGYGISINKQYCVKIPNNAHYVDSPTDVWLCDDGFKEIGNDCILETPSENESVKIETKEVGTEEPNGDAKEQKGLWYWIKSFINF